MKNRIRTKSKYWWLFLLAGVIAINYLASLVHYRLDLTSENRYTLTTTTKNLLRTVEHPVTIDVFLAGDLPADFRNLRNNADELLQEFREYSKSVNFRFNRPGEGLDASAKEQVLQ